MLSDHMAGISDLFRKQYFVHCTGTFPSSCLRYLKEPLSMTIVCLCMISAPRSRVKFSRHPARCIICICYRSPVLRCGSNPQIRKDITASSINSKPIVASRNGRLAFVIGFRLFRNHLPDCCNKNRELMQASHTFSLIEELRRYFGASGKKA
jgi:hypothetical protein